MKPVELVERAIANSSKSRGVVLASFAGSGTTLIAAENSAAGHGCSRSIQYSEM